MNDWRVAIAAALVRGWTWLYTTGMPPLFRDARRQEIACDLFESARDATSRAEPRSRTALHMLSRAVLGAGDDLTWRFEHMSLRRHIHEVEFWLAGIVVVIVIAASYLYEVMRTDTLPTPPKPLAFVTAPPPPAPPPPPPPPPGRGAGR